MNATEYKQLIDCAAGRIPADFVLANGRVIHVHTGEITSTDVAVINGRIAGLGDYEGLETIDLAGKYLSPGFIEGHIHIESSMLIPSQFAAAVIPHGTTTVICDPHEIANVCGTAGVHFMLSDDLPLSIYAMAPSCVPATHMETSGAVLSAAKVAELLDHPKIIGLAEMMNFPGTVAALPEVLAKIFLARKRGLPLDGHAPGLSGRELQAYVAAGINSDHECTTLHEAREKLRAGMSVFIREGSTAHNLEELLPIIDSPAAGHCLLVTDDRHADDLIEHGHLDHILRRAVHFGADPVTALQMVTINPALHFGFKNIGAIVPGFHADLVILDDLETFNVHSVFCKGVRTSAHGAVTMTLPPPSLETLPQAIQSSVNIRPEKINLALPAGSGRIRVIQCIDNQLVTRQQLLDPKVVNGHLVADVERDILKIAVIERHHSTQAIGLGFVQGLGLKNGAIGSTVAHDSHNLVVVGTSDAAMMKVIVQIFEMQGGLAVADDTTVHGSLPLPVAGLMSTAPAEEVCSSLRALHRALAKVGTTVKNPFMLLSFLALPVIPELKITDKGLVDVTQFCLVPLQEKKKV